MQSGRDAGTRIFHEDRRAVWRVTWTLALAFAGVAWLMQSGGVVAWILFLGISLLLAGIGVSALLARSKPVVGVGPYGLRVFTGEGGLGGSARPDAPAFTIPWEAVTRVSFEERVVHRRRAHEEHPMIVEPLCFRIADELPVRDGEGCFLERVSGRESEMAVGEHFLWSAGERTLDLVTAPRGGFGALTAAVERAAPRLGDASAGRRRGLGGAVSHAIYDAGLVLALAGIFLLWATGRTEVVAGVAQRVLAWGGSVGA